MDSMVALWWLKNHGDWSVFVANRVNEINSLVPSQFWRHVPGELNPADLLSRGISPRLFSDSLWWEGPSWLLEPPSNWPIDRLACETSEVEREKRKVRLRNLVAVEGEIPWPITYLSENSDDLVPLSPAMFLVENRNLDVPDIDYRDTVNLRKRVRYRQKLLNDLRQIPKGVYLGLLIQNKNKKGPLSEVRLGEIVLIGDDIKKRMHWPLAKVIRLIPGKDGKIRTVELKTRTGTIDNLSDPNDSSNVLPRVSKYGRVIKVPEKLELLTRCYMFLSPSDVDSKKGEDVEGHRNELFR
ncbi:integrase catalytic domain-containing protein [Trichonephila clavipes]|nr:integrase catalytic domain-containing protein [Trichonephila clavipes]